MRRELIYFFGMLCCVIGVTAFLNGGWSSFISRLKPKKSHAGHAILAPFAELPDPDKPYLVQWPSGQIETGWVAFKRCIPLPQQSLVEIGIRDDGVAVWRIRK